MVQIAFLIQQKVTMEELAKRAETTPYAGYNPSVNLTLIAIAGSQWHYAWVECCADERPWSTWPSWMSSRAENDNHVRSL